MFDFYLADGFGEVVHFSAVVRLSYFETEVLALDPLLTAAMSRTGAGKRAGCGR